MPGGNVLDGPQATGVVIEMITVKAKAPNSAERKCAKVQLTKNGNIVLAYIPFVKGSEYVDVRDTVTLENAKKKDLPNVKCQVIKVAGVSLSELMDPRKRRTRG